VFDRIFFKEGEFKSIIVESEKTPAQLLIDLFKDKKVELNEKIANELAEYFAGNSEERYSLI